MTDNHALLARLDKNKLDELFTSVLALFGDKTDVQIFEPEYHPEEKWTIVARGYALQVTAEMIGQLADYCESSRASLEWGDMIKTMVDNPNDYSLVLRPYVPVTEISTETSTLTGEDYESVDQMFIGIYPKLKEKYETLCETCRQASQYHTTLSHNLSQDVTLQFVPERGYQLDMHIVSQHPLSQQIVGCISHEYQREDFKAFFPADSANGKTKMVPYCDIITACLEGINIHLAELVYHNKNSDIQAYAKMIAEDFVTTLSRIGGIIPYYQFGEGVESVEDHPEITEVLDTLTVLLLNHVMSIPASAMGDDLAEHVDHYAFDYENQLIYARNANYQVIGELTDPQYALSPLIETVSEGAYGLLLTHLSSLRNQHVFKKMGKLVMAENKNVLH